MQKSINGLSPGSTYIVQVASIDGQGQSDWSPTLEITIPVPELTPNAPTNVTATGNPDNIKISWTQATQNTDGGTLAQPAYYEVYRGLTSNPTELVGKTSSSSFTYQTVLYKINQTFAVKTVDGFGNRSATSNTASSTALSPAVMNGLIEKLDSYSRPTGSTIATFNTVRSHNLQNGNYVFIYGTTGNFDTPSTTGATGGVPITYISDTSFSCSPNTSTAFSNVTSGAPGYMYPTEDAVRVRTDGITIGNMRTKHIVGIAPTSFNMQSADTGTRMTITSDGISMFRATGNTEEQTVSLVSATGDATIVGKFSTGFSPAARVVLDSGDTVPESIQFYSGSDIETDHGSILVDTLEDIGVREGQYVPFGTALASSNNQIPSTAVITASSNNVTLPTSTINVDDTTDYDATANAIDVETDQGWQTVLYTGKTATSFTGCTGGSGVINTGNKIGARIYISFISPHTFSTIPSSGGAWSDAISYNGELEFYNKTAITSSKTISGLTGSGPGTRTLTTTTAHGYTIGDVVVISGVTPSALNETVFVRSTPNTTSFTYTSAATGTRSSGGSTIVNASLRGVRLTAGSTSAINAGNIIYGYPRFGEIVITAPKTDDSVYPASSAVALTSAKMFGTNPVENPTVEINGKLRFPYAGDASLTGNTHAIQIGSTDSVNLVIDNNEIMGRNNGGTGSLLLNALGGNISTNGKGSGSGDSSNGVFFSDTGATVFGRSNERVLFINRYASTGTVPVVQFLWNGTNNGLINISSGGTPAFASGSDYRLKTNIEPLTDAIERMKNAKVYTFNKINDPEQNLLTGFLAHEVYDVIQDATIGEKDAVDENNEPVYQMVQDAKLIPIMAQAIHDLIDKVEALEQKINDML